MKRFLVIIEFVAITAIVLTGCKASEKKPDTVSEKKSDTILEKITPEQAKEIIDNNNDIIILDVRTEDEFNSGHIPGAVLIPDTEISDKAEELLTDKVVTLLVYCRSGRRSASAAQTLKDLGYQRIYDFGGIIDWPYDIVIE